MKMREKEIKQYIKELEKENETIYLMINWKRNKNLGKIEILKVLLEENENE
jgi:hypothetical protein